MLSHHYNEEFKLAVLRELSAKASSTRYELQMHNNVKVFNLLGISEMHWNSAWDNRSILIPQLNREVDGLDDKRVYLQLKRKHITNDDPRYPGEHYYYWRPFLEVRTRKYFACC